MINLTKEDFTLEDLKYIKRKQRGMKEIEKRVNEKKMNQIFGIQNKNKNILFK